MPLAQSAFYFYVGHEASAKGGHVRATLWICQCLVMLPIVAVWSAGRPLASADHRTRARAKITVLYDAFGEDTVMRRDWGYAALLEYGGQRILFDTGNNPNILARNARAKGVDLAALDFVVMSHRHGDHMGGLAYVLRVNPEVKIYAPKESFGVY